MLHSAPAERQLNSSNSVRNVHDTAMAILVVDDDQAVRDALRRALTMQGYSVDVAADGEEALTTLGKNGATVAFLDIPPGLDPEPLLARRVGVRGVAHYNEELHSRLITVRNLEAIESGR